MFHFIAAITVVLLSCQEWFEIFIFQVPLTVNSLCCWQLNMLEITRLDWFTVWQWVLKVVTYCPSAHTHTEYWGPHDFQTECTMGKCVSGSCCGKPAECETVWLCTVHISVVAYRSSSVWQSASLGIITVSICLCLQITETDWHINSNVELLVDTSWEC